MINFLIIIFVISNFLLGLLLFYQYYNFKNYLYIYNILSKYFTNYILLKNEIKRIFKIDYTQNGEYFQLFQNKIWVGDNSNEKTILNGYLYFLYNQIGNKDEFWDKIYEFYLYNEPNFYKIENDLLNQNGYFKDDVFYRNLYIAIFYNLDLITNNNSRSVLKDIYFLK